MAARFLQQARAAGVDTAEWTVQEVLSADELKLLAAHVKDRSPAWLRLNALVNERVAAATADP